MAVSDYILTHRWRECGKEGQSFHCLSLSFLAVQSFRFGPEVAYVACCLLSYLKGVKSQTLVGGLQPGQLFVD